MEASASTLNIAPIGSMDNTTQALHYPVDDRTTQSLAVPGAAHPGAAYPARRWPATTSSRRAAMSG
jgi:hypothetical protein